MMYVGCYLMVEMPSRKHEMRGSCPKCGLTGSPFCPIDGSPIPLIDVDITVSLEDVFENIDNRGKEIFDYIKMPIVKGDAKWNTLVFGSYSSYMYINCTKTRATYTSDYIIPVQNAVMTDMPVEDFSQDNWPDLLAALDNEQIPYKKGFGVILMSEYEGGEELNF